MIQDPGLTFLSGPELLAAELPPARPILDPILSTKSLALLYGPRGVGKTFMALGIARAAAAGESFLGWRASRPHRVVYVDGEMAAAEMQQRLRSFGPAPPTLRFLLSDLNRTGLDLAHYESQRRLMAAWGDPELAIFDNLASLSGLRTGDPDRWHEVQRFLMVQRQCGRGVLMLHHANKQGLQRGSSRREDILDLVMAMRRPWGWTPADGTCFDLQFEKTRSLHGAAIEPLRVRLEQRAGGIGWEYSALDDPLLDKAIELLGQGLGATRVAGMLGLSRAAAYRLRDRALQLGRLDAVPAPTPAETTP